MTAKDALARLNSDREARTRRERHGRGELTFLDGMPTNATGCLLPNGTFTDAECLVRHVAVPDDAQRVWTRRLRGTALRRRGRLKVDDGKALLFLDEPDADLVASADHGAVLRIPMHPAHPYRSQAAHCSEVMAPTVPISSRPPF
jgi:hypothetical protein